MEIKIRKHSLFRHNKTEHTYTQIKMYKKKEINLAMAINMIDLTFVTSI